MVQIILIPLATVCSQSLGWDCYRKEFAPIEEQILFCKSAIPNPWKEVEEIIPASLFYSMF